MDLDVFRQVIGTHSGFETELLRNCTVDLFQVKSLAIQLKLFDKIVDGWLEFDATIATPDLMRTIMPKLGRILGPRGLMPNAKTGTVTMEVGEAVSSIKAGQIEYRVEKESGVVHVPIGKISFDGNQIKENLQTVMEALIRARPASTKGRYLRSVAVSSTMGAGIRLDPAQFSG